MTMRESFDRMGADYDDVIRRLRDEERVKRFLFRFPDDQSYPTLCEALRSGDAEEAFRAAHSIKGICMNLGLTALYQSADRLTESLRGGQITEECGPLFEQVEWDYRKTLDGIRDMM